MDWWIGFVFAVMAVTIVVLGWVSARQRIRRDVEQLERERDEKRDDDVA